MENRLAKAIEGKRVFEAKRIIREWEIANVEEAKEVIDFYVEDNDGKHPREIVESYNSLLRTYGNVLRINKERNNLETVDKLEQSMELWRKELATLERALEIISEKGLKVRIEKKDGNA